MLTPKFSLDQDESFLYLKMHVPHLKLNETEIHTDDDEIYFHSKPYFLRLHLPGSVVEDERSKSSYDVDSGWLSISLPKQNKGEYFSNLEMLTKLLTPKSTKPTISTANVEVISSEVNAESEKEDSEISNNENNFKPENKNETELDDVDPEEFDWFIEQTPYNENAELLLSKNISSYGFANQNTNSLNALTQELSGMIDLIDPDSISRKQRTILRHEQEHNVFDCEHYLADFFEEDQILYLISLDFFKDLTGTTDEDLTKFTDDEQEILLKLPRKEYIIDQTELSSVYLGLVDILFAYAFDIRQTGGEQSIESDWTICKLSSSLSWLDSFTDLREVLLSSCRRCLCFPLYRNWKFLKKVLSDVQLIFDAGKPQILKCLLNIYSILKKSEAHYPLVEIFLKDYCVWIQSACEKRLKSISKAIKEIQISKDDVGFRLSEMETDAKKLMEADSEDDEIEGLASAISNTVNITEVQTDSDDETSSSGDSSSEVESSDESDSGSDDSGVNIKEE